ncbi:glucosamine-6-phosphate deaminase [Neobacillus sp. MER 74]|uniref:glucosamine-6-phosphate deaminase n=1 Tax=Neobacillus sp. MER 74 TaxID=2939566 RepID=UPI00204103AA|nr:glucosamine-6-phosphate deaminase [Neobacillus sp. MER 74]MCM3118084.1 glucosamine-6-phosphate deaminase [Neobacillus sp. MER 74]
MRISVFRDSVNADRVGASILLKEIREKLNPKLGLATGSSPVGIYRQLAELYRRNHFSFKHVSSFNLDEYVGLSEDHPQSYAAFMREHLFQHLDIEPRNIHIPNGIAESAEEECIRYEKLLQEAGPLDIQLLGIGLNGHIGFNEPGKNLSSETHLVTLTEETRRANARWFLLDGQTPRQAITMGVGPIMKAKKVLLIAQGEEKSSIIQEAFLGPITTHCPASLLQLHPNLLVLLDEAAASRLIDDSQPSFRIYVNKRIDFLYEPDLRELVQ